MLDTPTRSHNGAIPPELMAAIQNEVQRLVCYDGLIVERRTVTPEQALVWLESNSENRNLSTREVKKIASDMQSGRFHVNGATVCFDTKGRLIDGQHRLNACVEADTEFDTLVVWGLPRGQRLTMDCGKRRSMADRLSMQSVSYASHIATALIYLHDLAEPSASRKGRRHQLTDASKLQLHSLRGERLQYWHSEVGKNRGLDALAAASCAGMEIIGKADRAQDFAQVIKTGWAPTPNHPALRLRERLISTKGTPTDMKLRLCSAAIKAQLEERGIQVLRSASVGIPGLTDEVLWGEGTGYATTG